MSNAKKEIEAMAVASIVCPSCKAVAGGYCHYVGYDDYVGSDGRLVPLRKVKTHQRRLSKFVAEHLSERIKETPTHDPQTS